MEILFQNSKTPEKVLKYLVTPLMVGLFLAAVMLLKYSVKVQESNYATGILHGILICSGISFLAAFLPILGNWLSKPNNRDLDK